MMSMKVKTTSKNGPPAAAASGEGAWHSAGEPIFDVVFTFIDMIIAGDPGHPLSRVPFFLKIFFRGFGG